MPHGSGCADRRARGRELVADAVAALRAAWRPQETLAELVPERRVLGIPRAARMTPIGRVWRLGVLLLDEAGGVWDTGRVVRAERAARKSITAEAVAEQRALRAAAVKGGIPRARPWSSTRRPIDLDELARDGASGPLVVRGRRGARALEPRAARRAHPLDATSPTASTCSRTPRRGMTRPTLPRIADACSIDDSVSMRAAMDQSASHRLRRSAG